MRLLLASGWGYHRAQTDTLFIVGERHLRETPLHEHAEVLRKFIGTLCASATELPELRHAGVTVRRGDNDIRPSIATVSARLRADRLKVLRTHCPNLIAEAQLYRYPDRSERAVLGENPIDDSNHALGALRYLVSKIDARFMAKLKGRSDGTGPRDLGPDYDETQAALGVPAARPWLRVDNEELWE